MYCFLLMLNLVIVFYMLMLRNLICDEIGVLNWVCYFYLLVIERSGILIVLRGLGNEIGYVCYICI